MGIERLNEFWPDWRIEGCIGEGAYGKVYKAVKEDPYMRVYSAIKVLSVPNSTAELESLKNDGLTIDDTKTYLKSVVADVVNEIKVMETLKSYTNIVSVEDYKILEKTDGIGWEIFIRMDLLEPFHDYSLHHAMSEKEIIKLGIDICSALEVCHQKNIIHRDIKPANLFVSPNGDFKIGDFGVAKELEKTSGAMSTKGTYYYMAPEVAHSQRYDATVDIYSLGIVLYMLLNGNRPPFCTEKVDGNTYNERKKATERRMRGEALPPPSEATPELAKIILCACDYNPQHRFRNPKAFKNALLNYIQGDTKPAPKPEPKPAPSPSPDDIVPISEEEAEKNIKKFKKKKKSGRAPIIILLILLVLVLSGALVFTVLSLVDAKGSDSQTDESASQDVKSVIPLEEEEQDPNLCVDGTEHEADNWIETKAPTYLETGLKGQYCSKCNQIIATEDIPVLEYEGFTDVKETDWFSEGVEYCFKHGYITGYSDGSFKPDDTLTREQFAVILSKVAAADLSTFTETDLEDIDPEAWYASYVIWATNEGYLTARNGKFGLGQKLNRQELACALYRFAQKQGKDVTNRVNLEAYTDYDKIADWARDSVSWSIATGFFSSTSSTKQSFSPDATVTRAQVAKIFMVYNEIR